MKKATYTYNTIIILSGATANDMTTALNIQGALGWNLINTSFNAGGDLYAFFIKKETTPFTSN